MQCSKCKAEAPQNALYCPMCGFKLSGRVITQHKPKSRGNGQGTAYKRGKTWTAEYTIGYTADKKRISKRKGGFATKKEALEYAVTQRLNPYAEKNKVTLEMLYKIVYEQDICKLSGSKQRGYNIAWQRIKSIQKTDINDLSLPFLQSYIDDMELTMYLARDIKILLNKMYTYAEQCDYITKNYIKHIKLPEAGERKERVIFSESDIGKLWETWNAGNEYAEIAGYILIMIHTGMRTGELINVEVCNISLSDNTITNSGIKTKKGKRRPFIILPMIKPIVEKLMSDGREKLCNLPDFTFHRRYVAMAKELDLTHNATPYCARHTCATVLTKANVPPAVIMDILGHTEYQTSLIYTHNSVETMREEMKKAFDDDGINE